MPPVACPLRPRRRARNLRLRLVRTRPGRCREAPRPRSQGNNAQYREPATRSSRWPAGSSDQSQLLVSRSHLCTRLDHLPGTTRPSPRPGRQHARIGRHAVTAADSTPLAGDLPCRRPDAYWSVTYRHLQANASRKSGRQPGSPERLSLPRPERLFGSRPGRTSLGWFDQLVLAGHACIAAALRVTPPPGSPAANDHEVLDGSGRYPCLLPCHAAGCHRRLRVTWVTPLGLFTASIWNRSSSPSSPSQSRSPRPSTIGTTTMCA